MQDGTAVLKLEVYEMHARSKMLADSQDEGLVEVAGWYDDLIDRMREHIAERESLD
jgi:hypothetical protein